VRMRVFVGFFFFFLPLTCKPHFGIPLIACIYCTVRLEQQFLFPFPGLTQLGLPTTFVTLHETDENAKKVKPHAELFGESKGLVRPSGSAQSVRNGIIAPVKLFTYHRLTVLNPPCSTCGGFFISRVIIAMLDKSTITIQ